MIDVSYIQAEIAYFRSLATLYYQYAKKEPGPYRHGYYWGLAQGHKQAANELEALLRTASAVQ